MLCSVRPLCLPPQEDGVSGEAPRYLGRESVSEDLPLHLDFISAFPGSDYSGGLSADLGPAGTLKAPDGQGGGEPREGLEGREMKQRGRHLIFLPKSNRPSLPGRERAALSARQTVPSPRGPPRMEGAPAGPLSAPLLACPPAQRPPLPLAVMADVPPSSH